MCYTVKKKSCEPMISCEGQPAAPLNESYNVNMAVFCNVFIPAFSHYYSRIYNFIE